MFFLTAPSIYDCTFENNTCTWTQALDDTFNWTRHQGSTLSRFTGPSTDHTTGGATGFYMYIETSFPRKPNDTARFESAMVPATQQKCLQFWYHMYGPHVDTLNVYTKVKQQLGSPVWTRSGTQGNKWKHATLSLTVSSKFKVNKNDVTFEHLHGILARICFIQHLVRECRVQRTLCPIS